MVLVTNHLKTLLEMLSKMKIPKRFYVFAGTLVCGSLLIVDLVFGTLLFHFCPQLSWNLCSTLAS